MPTIEIPLTTHAFAFNLEAAAGLPFRVNFTIPDTREVDAASVVLTDDNESTDPITGSGPTVTSADNLVSLEWSGAQLTALRAHRDPRTGVRPGRVFYTLLDDDDDPVGAGWLTILSPEAASSMQTPDPVVGVSFGDPVEAIDASQYAPKSQLWTPATAYIVGQLVHNAGTLYRVSTAHTSPGSFTTDNLTALSGGSGGANLTYTQAAGNGVVVSDSGTDATIPAADGTNAGLMLPAQVTKLSGLPTVNPSVNTQTGATYTMVAGDENNVLAGNRATGQAFTVPPNSSVAFTVEAGTEVRQLGAGAITLTAGVGVTITPQVGKTLVTAGAGSIVWLVKTNTDAWLAIGDLVLADDTVGNATTSAHGLLKKLDNTATHYMDGTGNWSTPAGGSSGGGSPGALMPSARQAPGGARIVTNLFGFQSGSMTTLAIPAGTQFLVLANCAGGTIEELGIMVSATSLTGVQPIEVSCYTDLADAGPGTRVWNQSIAVGTTTGEINTTGLALANPTGLAWLSVTNPSGNAGSVTLRSLIPEGCGRHLAMQNATARHVYSRTGLAAAPTDMSPGVSPINLFRATIATTEIGVDIVATFPILGVQAA